MIDIDPDNPPLTGHEKWEPAKDAFLRRIAAHRARYLESQQAIQVWEDDGGSITEGSSLHTAHAHTVNNRRFLAVGGEAGCFYCLKTFAAKAVTFWVDDGRTALCPHCQIDAVLSSNVDPIDLVFLREMRAYWFERSVFRQGVYV